MFVDWVICYIDCSTECEEYVIEYLKFGHSR